MEIPNPTSRIVTIRELFESGEWEHGRGTLPIALGRDLEGKPVIADLTKMPHLLIAGATGTGKSVTINTIITSLIYQYTQRELRLLMIDPKMVELSMYNALPHLRHKVVTNNHDAASVLKWAVFEMQRRYELLQANGARNIADFNRKVQDGKPLRNPPRPKPTLTTVNAEAPDTPPEPPTDEVYGDGMLPFIVMIIDELADLMMTVQGEVETPLAILAQKARAIGIHLILATQRPSVNVITGLIKANFPCRIAFRVASKVDSRTILDQNGAEALLGNGDMLFLPPGKSEPMRLQASYITTDESERITEWYVARRAARREAAQAAEAQEADILELVRAQEGEAEAGPESAEGERDALFREAAEACIQNRVAPPRSCSGGCGSATAGQPESSTSSTTPGFWVPRMAASRAMCLWASINWMSTAGRAGGQAVGRMGGPCNCKISLLSSAPRSQHLWWRNRPASAPTAIRSTSTTSTTSSRSTRVSPTGPGLIRSSSTTRASTTCS